MNAIRPAHRRSGFTLIELIVVLGIIGVLVSMLLPAVQYARSSSRKTQCQSQLRQIGLALTQYLDVRGTQAKFPDCAPLPDPAVWPNNPSITKALGDFSENNAMAWACPSDVLPAVPSAGPKSYFETYGVSYYYNRSNLSATTPAPHMLNRQQVKAGWWGRRGSSTKGEAPSSVIFTLYDADTFHSSSTLASSADHTDVEPGATNWLFLDGHVEATPPPGS